MIDSGDRWISSSMRLSLIHISCGSSVDVRFALASAHPGKSEGCHCSRESGRYGSLSLIHISMRTHTPSSCPPAERNEPNGTAKPPKSTERCNASPSSPPRTTERTRSNATGMIRATARTSHTVRKHKLSLTLTKCANGQSK